ncbi:3-hydroxyacyl-CoA dehydrogenase family protein [Desulfobacula sp.]|uniref:3-hydroxyacyl-CoA dehydrogenase family protein n=1 Tax=Desulfobacula sp. TaxID=2593537 RepID=UPI0026100F99|nr:3-hydroxyacyl-CoA dehydrogenase family protein [Desulfobacula sp.]
MKKIWVIGSGIMGSGIAQTCCQAGYHVSIMDTDGPCLDKAVHNIERALQKLEKKQLLDQKAADIFANLKKETSFNGAATADMVIEAVFENITLKQDIFKALESICGLDTIFATNTSAIPITDISAAIAHPQRFLGLHFFNPVHKMKLVEIIKSLATSEDTVETARQFVFTLAKEPVVVNRDSAGFIVNRINGMAFLEALRLLEKGVASVEDIDKAIRLGLGNPMGPFELMDLVGLDVVLNARLNIYNETREPAHFPPGILKNMVKAGYLGRKTGKGFYDYT